MPTDILCGWAWCEWFPCVPEWQTSSALHHHDCSLIWWTETSKIKHMPHQCSCVYSSRRQDLSKGCGRAALLTLWASKEFLWTHQAWWRQDQVERYKCVEHPGAVQQENHRHYSLWRKFWACGLKLFKLMENKCHDLKRNFFNPSMPLLMYCMYLQLLIYTTCIGAPDRCDCV